MSVFRKAMVYLGLVDDGDEFAEDDYYGDELYEPEPEPARAERTPRPRPSAVGIAEPSPVTVIRRSRERDEHPTAAVRAQPVRPVPMAATRVHVMEPKGFNDAQEVGDRLKASQPVILNLQGVDRDLQRRLIDFSSGLAYALDGTMSKAADQVFLLTPANVEVSEDEKERLQARGLYRSMRS
jgi:cell division inhibitor SepF